MIPSQNLSTITELITTYLQSPNHGWSMGSFGAIAEFTWDQGEPRLSPESDTIGVITERGAMALNLNDNIQPIAYEYLSKNAQQWVHGVIFCMPEHLATMQSRSRLTELGRDVGALKAEHRDHVLFDLGLNQGFVDVMIRTADNTLIKLLRDHEGSDILDPTNPAMKAIIQAGPNRVFETAAGRLEVFQPIGIEKTPDGPHTHVLPRLLSSGRACSANIPLPEGMLPVFNLHPAHPCRDKLGQYHNFDMSHHNTFQTLLGKYAVDEFCAQKEKAITAMKNGVQAEQFDTGNSRLLRTATRVALRQSLHLDEISADTLQAWQGHLEKDISDLDSIRS